MASSGLSRRGAEVESQIQTPEGEGSPCDRVTRASRRTADVMRAALGDA
jgi:hypothetical protein